MQTVEVFVGLVERQHVGLGHILRHFPLQQPLFIAMHIQRATIVIHQCLQLRVLVRVRFIIEKDVRCPLAYIGIGHAYRVLVIHRQIGHSLQF